MEKRASELVVGDLVRERDGAFFRVASIQPYGYRLELLLENVNGYVGTPRWVNATVKRGATVMLVEKQGVSK